MEEPNLVSNDLDLELNPKKGHLHDILAKQDIRIEETEEEKATAKGVDAFIKAKNPMENLDLNSIPSPKEPARVYKLPENETDRNIEQNNEEIYVLQPEFLHLIKHLELFQIHPEKRKYILDEFEHRSLSTIKSRLDHLLNYGYFTPVEHKKALEILESDHDPMAVFPSEGEDDGEITHETKKSALDDFESENAEVNEKENTPTTEEKIEDIEEDIRAESFEELYEKIKALGDITNSSGRILAPKETIDNIKFIREKKMYGLLFQITRKYGLRKLVKDLMDKETLELEEPNILETEEVEGEIENPINPVGLTILENLEPKTGTEPTEIHNSLERIEKKDVELETARNDYAKAKVAYTKKNTKLHKVRGLIKNLIKKDSSEKSEKKTETEIEVEEAKEKMEVARAEYIRIKTLRKKEFIDAFVEKEKNNPAYVGVEEHEVLSILRSAIKTELLNRAEEEWDTLLREIKEKEGKGIIGRTMETIDKKGRIEKITQSELIQNALQIWTRQDKVGQAVRFGVRTVIPSLLIGGAMAFTGGAAAGFAAGGVSFARRTGGFAGGLGAGIWRDRKDSQVNEEEKEKYEDSYVDPNLTSEQREEKYMEAREKEVKRMKMQKVKKAIAMVGAGGGVGILSGAIAGGIEHGFSIGPKGGHVENMTGVKGGGRPAVGQEISRPGLPHEPTLPRGETLPPIKSETPTADILSTKTSLSSSGYLQDIHNLKANIRHTYGDNIPPEIKTNIMDKSAVALAKEYGFYKPGSTGGDSGLGFAGEKLSVDTNGHLVIEHVDGTKDFLSDVKTGQVKQFAGKMFTPEAPKVTSAVDVNLETEVPKGDLFANPRLGKQLDFDVANSLKPESPLPEMFDKPFFKPDNTPVDASVDHIPYENSFVDVVEKAGSKSVVFNGTEIAHEQAFGTGKILTLDDKFQDGAQNASVRGAFAKAFEQKIAEVQLGKTTHLVPFEGGAVHIVQGIEGNDNAVLVLQNGKEIAKGLVTDKGTKINFNGNLKGGALSWFVETPYERALKFKEVKNIIKSLKVAK